MKTFDFIRIIMKIFDLIKIMKIFDLIKIMKIFNLIKLFQSFGTNSNFGFHALENPLPARSVLGPFTRSFTIGRGSRHLVTEPTGHDRNEKVTRAKNGIQSFTKKWTNFVK